MRRFIICLFQFFSSRLLASTRRRFRSRVFSLAPSSSCLSYLSLLTLRSCFFYIFKLMIFPFPTTMDLIDARASLSLVCLNLSEHSWCRRSRADTNGSAAWTISCRHCWLCPSRVGMFCSIFLRKDANCSEVTGVRSGSSYWVVSTVWLLWDTGSGGFWMSRRTLSESSG